MSSGRILVTGFEPFGGEKINPSQEILKTLAQKKELSEKCDFLLLPVDYTLGPQKLLQAWRQGSYQAWLGLGQAGGRSQISLERLAINWKEVDFNVREGQRIQPEALVPDQTSAIINPLDLAALKQSIIDQKIPCEVSVSAGAYICNAVYFHWLLETAAQVPGLFVHVPFLPQQHHDRPHLELSVMVEAASHVLKFLGS